MDFGLSGLISAPFNAMRDAFRGDAPSLPGLPGSSGPGPGGFSPFQDHGGLEGFPQFPLNPLFATQPQADQGPSAEERLEAFKDDKGQPLWKTEQQRQALLKILEQDPSMTVEKFQRGQEMTALSGMVYSCAADSKKPLPEGYTRVQASELGLDPSQLDDPSTGLHAEIFKDERTGSYTLAFRGSNDMSTDWKHGNSQAFDPGAKQYDQAIKLAQALKDKLGDKFTDITGHSMGGGLAAAASAMTGVRATTFNAAGLNPATITSRGGSWDEARMAELITNYRVAGDPLTEAQEGSDTDPLSAYVSSHHGGWGAYLIGELGHQIGQQAGSPVQNSYISGPNAQVLPDAVGTQVTLVAFSQQDGHELSRREQMNADTWDWLHNFGAIGAGMLLEPGNPGPAHTG